MAISPNVLRLWYLNFRPEVVELVREAGLELAKDSTLACRRIASLLLHRGDLKALPMRMGAMVASPLWSLRGKLRLLGRTVYLLQWTGR